nr:uncharacterized protein K02A2.6-like [Lepeophtheirus salmonis]
MSWVLCKKLRILPEDYPSQIERGKWKRAREPSARGIKEMKYISDEEIKTMRDKLVEEYPDVLIDGNQPLRKMKCAPIKISLMEGAETWKMYTARAIPFAYREATKKELEELLKKGIIEPLGNKPTEWCHPMVVVGKKNGKVRLTVDLTKLNKFVKRPIHPMTNPKEIISNIKPGNKYFSTFDAIKGYWQIPLHYESQDLTTFITPWGRFKFKRWPMGLNATSDVFNLMMDQAYGELPNTKKLVDDILKYDETFEHHVKSVKEFLDRSRKFGISLNKEKFQFAKPKVEYIGYIVGEHGINIDPRKTEALSKIPAPQNRTELRSFMGMVNQMSGFSKEIANLSVTLRPLLSNKNEYIWTKEQDDIFEDVKKSLVKLPQKSHFMPNRKTVLETDASKKKSLGYILRQEDNEGKWHLIEANSRWLSAAEQNYGMTTLEMMAIYWATKKLNVYLQGLPHFHIETDHQAIVNILNKKTLDEIENPRQKEIKERTQMRYNFTVAWKPGRKMLAADNLSRNPYWNPRKDDILEDVHTNEVARRILIRAVCGKKIQTDQIKDRRLRKLRDQAQEDVNYLKLINFIKDGFGNNIKNLPEELKLYWNLRDSLSIYEGLIIVNNKRIVIPRVARKEILENLHVSHQGIVKTKQRAREIIYWPGIDIDIEDMVRKCEECQKLLPSLLMETQIKGPKMTRPFQAVAVDIFSVSGNNFLVYVDRLSGYPALHYFEHSGCTSRVIKKVIERFFIDYGIPEVLESDGETNFSSREFQEFLSFWGVEWRCSSPHNPQSNGLAEACVKKLKYLVKKTMNGNKIDQSKINLGILEMRNTPRIEDGLSPTKIVFGRSTRSIIPMLPEFHQKRSQALCKVPNPI